MGSWSRCVEDRLDMLTPAAAALTCKYLSRANYGVSRVQFRQHFSLPREECLVLGLAGRTEAWASLIAGHGRAGDPGRTSLILSPSSQLSIAPLSCPFWSSVPSFLTSLALLSMTGTLPIGCVSTGCMVRLTCETLRLMESAVGPSEIRCACATPPSRGRMYAKCHSFGVHMGFGPRTFWYWCGSMPICGVSEKFAARSRHRRYRLVNLVSFQTVCGS